MTKYKIALVLPSLAEHDHYMFRRLLRRAGYQPEQFTVFYADAPDLYAALARLHPHCVVAMGDESLRVLFGQTELLRWFGRSKTLMVMNPDTKENVSFPVLVSLAPSQLLAHRAEEDDDNVDTPRRKAQGIRSPARFQGLAVGLLRRAFHLAEHGIEETGTDYLQDPTPEGFAEWAEMALKTLEVEGGFLSWDIETAYKMKARDEDEFDEWERQRDNTILRISFSHAPGVAVSVPWQGQYLPIIQRLLDYPGYHAGWNIGGFDVPIVTKAGMRVGGTVLDFMDGWHLLQPDLDKGLEFVSSVYTDLEPWKHLADQHGMEALYSCIDADAALRNALGIVEGLKFAGLWDRFLQEMALMEVLRAAGRRGNVIDQPTQQELGRKLEAKLKELLNEAQRLVGPDWLRAKFYVRKPKEAAGEWVSVELKGSARACSVCGKQNVNKKHPCLKTGAVIHKVEVPQTKWFQKALPEGATLADIKEWLKGNGFNPNSDDQLLAYIRGHKHPVGYNHKTERDSADSKHLLKLAARYGAKHPIYPMTVEIHKVQKALSTYVYGMRPDDQGRVHTEYVNATKTWRLASRNVNMQNQGKREGNPYAKEARKTIVASPGHVLVQADSSSIEAVMVGHFMNDPNYIALAKQSIHAYVCCKKLGWEFTPENVKRVKKEQSGLYDSIKTVVHGTSFGMTPYLMHMNRPDLFPTMNAAKATQDFLFEVLPNLKQWQWDVRQFAHKNNYLMNPWGLKLYLYDVFTYQVDKDARTLIYGPDGKPKIKLGKDGNLAVAFLPQSSAGMFCRDNLLLLSQTEACPWMGANVSVHDGYCLDVPEDKVDRAIDILSGVLTRPIKEMGGLQIGCEVEVGPNWADMKKVKTIHV